MRIEVYLKQSPIFCVSLVARRFDALITDLFKADDLNKFEALTLAALFFESSVAVKPSQLAETFETTRGNMSHCISSLEARGLVQRRIDPEDARGYRLSLKPLGKKTAVRVIGMLDRIQREFENEVGKDVLQSTLLVMSRLGDGFTRTDD
jgi:DNA-binding MarR family transcriptional regulator